MKKSNYRFLPKGRWKKFIGQTLETGDILILSNGELACVDSAYTTGDPSTIQSIPEAWSFCFENGAINDRKRKKEYDSGYISKTGNDEAYRIVKSAVESRPNDEFLKECWRDGNKGLFGFMGHSRGKDKNWHISLGMERKKGEETFICPRVAEATMQFQVEHGNKATWDKIGEDRVCSYCGSMHPEDLLNLVKKRGLSVIQMTDKSYKWYVDRPEIPNAGFGAIKFYTPHLTKEVADELNRLSK